MPDSVQRRLGELYSSHAARSLRLAYLMTGDRDAAEDVVQDAFVRIFARFKDRKEPANLEAYLRRAIINLTHDRHRRLRSSRAFIARERNAGAMHTPDVESQLILRTRLRRLPHRQRAALVLRYYEDLSENEVAEILHCSVGALKKLVQRGLRHMRAQEGDGGYEQ